MAGEPEGLKVTVHGDRSARLGLIRRESISVKLLDCFGNHLPIRPEQAELVNLQCKGLDEGLLTKIVEVASEIFTFLLFCLFSVFFRNDRVSSMFRSREAVV